MASICWISVLSASSTDLLPAIDLLTALDLLLAAGDISTMAWSSMAGSTVSRLPSLERLLCTSSRARPERGPSRLAHSSVLSPASSCTESPSSAEARFCWSIPLGGR